MIDATNPLFKSDLRGWHKTNIAIHAINGALVYALLLSLFSPLSAVLGALIFVAHPSSTAAVSPIGGRSSTLCATFYIAGLIAAVIGVWWLALPLAYLAMRCKEEAAMWPVVALVTVWAIR